ncbi:MAG: ABC transporter substrate-binding protein [Rhodospirillales bacterium]
MMPVSLRSFAAAAAAAFALAAGAASAQERPLIDAPSLAKDVAEGRLPPLAERLPQTPAVVDVHAHHRKPGRHGGALSTVVGRSKDTRLMVVFGYARLAVYDTDFKIKPDILAGYEVEEGRRFTLRLRPGHRWSDGHPFTAEDFRYFWEDVANNKELSPVGPPHEMMVDGKPPKVEYPDQWTVRYTWDGPNPRFLPALAGTAPLYIYRPAHYLRQFHVRYADKAALDDMVKKAKRRNWAALHNNQDNQYQNDNPALPSLEPWVLVTKPPSQRFEFVRNPYYHRVDAAGRQLPYIDKVMLHVVDPKITPAKVGAGEVDLQARGLAFSNYPFLKQGEKSYGYSVYLWESAKGAQVALYPNLNANDAVWRALFRDVRFRRALSLASNRHEVNQVVYFGLGLTGNNTVLPQSPLYRKEYREAWTQFDLKRANALLDEIGLTRRDSRGVRLLPDGRPMEIVIETAGEETEQTDVLALIHDSWLKAGIKTYTRPSQREVFRNRIFAGETLMSVWSGWENGLPTPDIMPAELAPTDQQQLQWPKWGQYLQTGGAAGEAPDMDGPKELLDLYHRWIRSATEEERVAIWHRMLEINAEQVYTIGLVAAVPQPIVVRNTVHNVPRKGFYNWEPGAHFGIYRPDTFWIEEEAPRQSAQAP